MRALGHPTPSATMSASLPRRLLGGLVRAAVLVAGAAFALLALAAGLLLGLGVYAWARLRGRPALRVQAFRWRGMPGRSGAPSDVVDIDAREVHDAASLRQLR